MGGSVSIAVTDRRLGAYSFRGRVASAMTRSYSARLMSRRVDTFALAILPIWHQRLQVHLLMSERASNCSTLNHSWHESAGGNVSSGIKSPCKAEFGVQQGLEKAPSRSIFRALISLDFALKSLRAQSLTDQLAAQYSER